MKPKKTNQQKRQSPTKEKETFNQKASGNIGNTIQAGRDVHIHIPESSDNRASGNNKSRIKRIALVVGILASFSTIFAFVFEISTRQKKQQEMIKDKKQDSIFITGIIREKGTSKGIENAWIVSEQNPYDTITVTSDGSFELKATGIPGQSVRFYSGALGYKTRNEYHILVKPISIYLEREN